MGTPMRLWWLLLLAACSSGPPPGSNAKRVEARNLYAAEAALSLPGTQVCRRLPVGLSEEDWIWGRVVKLAGGRVEVKIEDPGRYPHGIEKGALVSQSVLDWLPCER